MALSKILWLPSCLFVKVPPCTLYCWNLSRRCSSATSRLSILTVSRTLSLLHSSILLCISVVSYLSVLLNVTNTWLASEVKALLMIVLHLSILSGGLSKMPLIRVPRKFSRHCTTTKAICVEWASNFFNSVEWTQIRHVSEGKQRSYNGLFGVDVSASINTHIRRPTTKSTAEGDIVDLISCSELKLNWFYRIQIMCR